MRVAQKGVEAAAIGRSRGGLTTKLHAAVDAMSLPIRIHPTPGQYGDRPQAEALLAGLKGVGHIIADAAYDADPLRAFIASDLGATAHIKANPSRTGKPPIDWSLYKERHQVECFFNKLKRSAASPSGARNPSPHSWASFTSLAPSYGYSECRQRLGSRLIHSQKATAAASTTAD